MIQKVSDPKFKVRVINIDTIVMVYLGEGVVQVRGDD